MRASKGLVSLALAGVAMLLTTVATMSAGLPVARAQIRLPEASTEDQAPLPDVAAIERGAKARATDSPKDIVAIVVANVVANMATPESASATNPLLARITASPFATRRCPRAR